VFVFVSYKSEDSNLVRQVAEQLIASGLDVWINEYQILVGEYEQFEDGIKAGIGRATHAVVFTNNRWAQAEWCLIEMRGLLEQIPDRSRIVEVAIPWEGKPREVFPELLGRPAVVYQGDPRRPAAADVHRLVVEILERLGFSTDLTALPAVEPHPDWLPSAGVTLDPGPFRLWDERTRSQWLTRWKQGDLVLGLRTIVYHLGTDLDVSMDVYATNYESPISRLVIDETGASDDRAVYTAYRRYAKSWLPSEHGHFRHIWYEPKGLHLVFVGGTSQIALTYLSKMEGETEPGAQWERRYAVRIPNPLCADAKGELAFVFSVRLQGDEARQLRSFCRLAPWFDAVVTSAKLRWPSRGQSFVMQTTGFLAKAITAGVIGWMAWRMYAQHLSPVRLAGAALLVGITAGDFGSYVFSRTYRALLASIRPAMYDVLPVSSGRRFVSDLWHQAFIQPFVLSGLLWRGLVSALAYFVGYLTVPLIVGGLLFGKKVAAAPPLWLRAHWLELALAGVVLFGIAASQFTRTLVRARFLKVRKKEEDQP
jgi:hypothetical protein